MCSILGRMNWAVLTSHHRWIFFRLVYTPEGRHIFSYSTVESQSGNTRPFLALLATLLDASGLITIPPTDLGPILTDIQDSQQHSNPEDAGDSPGHSDSGSEYTSTAKPSSSQPPITCSKTSGGQGNIVLQVSDLQA